MLISELHKLDEYRAKAKALEKKWIAEKQTLLALPGRLGYKSVSELMAALKFATREKPMRKRFDRGTRRKRRVTITEDIRHEVKRLVGVGRTGEEIARQLHLSPASVQNIKASLGLTKKRK